MIMSTIVDISAIVILLQTSLYEDYNSYPGLTFWTIMESSDTRHILLRNYSLPVWADLKPMLKYNILRNFISKGDFGTVSVFIDEKNQATQ